MAEEKETTKLYVGQRVRWNREWLAERGLDRPDVDYREEPGTVMSLTPGGAIVRWQNGCTVPVLEKQIQRF